MGIDIGNSTTEACLGQRTADGEVSYLSSGLAPTTGVKGTPPNVDGVSAAVTRALEAAGRRMSELTRVYVNEATPVVSGLAMETITETVITESTMIGHDPRTPGASGLGVGETVALDHLPEHTGDAIVVVPAGVDFEDVAEQINAAMANGTTVVAAILGSDDAVLVANRVSQPFPIVDEVAYVDAVPLGMKAAVEVAEMGHSIRQLSNPYGIATLFGLSPEETKAVSPVARALTGNRSAVVVRTPSGDVTDRRIPAGSIQLEGTKGLASVDITEGAQALMAAIRRNAPLTDVNGETGTNVGGMLSSVKQTMATLVGAPTHDVRIRDVLAVDTLVPLEVRGGLAHEVSLENAVALASMVRTSHGPMRQVADAIAHHFHQHGAHVRVEIGGVEAEMAVVGALTTPGTSRPLVVLDLGGGSTDAARISVEGVVESVHLAGAGDLVTKLIDAELGLGDLELAEAVKRAPLAKAESFYHIRHENGTAQFLSEPLSPHLYAHILAMTEEGMLAIPTRHEMERVREVRRSAKRRVFCTNAIRALESVVGQRDLRKIGFVVLLGGCALDFEIPQLIADDLAPFGIVCGTGNVRGSEGPRNAVASGLVATSVDTDRVTCP